MINFHNQSIKNSNQLNRSKFSKEKKFQNLLIKFFNKLLKLNYLTKIISFIWHELKHPTKLIKFD